MSTMGDAWIEKSSDVHYCGKAETYISKRDGQWVVWSLRHEIRDAPTGETDVDKAKYAALQMVFSCLDDELGMIEDLLSEDD